MPAGVDGLWSIAVDNLFRKREVESLKSDIAAFVWGTRDAPIGVPEVYRSIKAATPKKSRELLHIDFMGFNFCLGLDCK